MEDKTTIKLSLVAPVALALALTLAACVGDDPGTEHDNAVATDAGQSADSKVAEPGDAGATAPGVDDAGDARATLPLIDQYSVSTTTWSGTKTDCANKVDAAIKALGGGYVLNAGGSSFARYGDRPGAVIVAVCLDDAAKVVTQAWAIKTAANALNDETRLKNLVFDTVAPPISPAAAGFPKIHAAETVRKVAGLALSTCQTRAKSAIDATSAKAPPSPNKWTKLGGNFVAIGGTDGTTASITCLGDASGSVVLDIFTIDPAVDAEMLLETLDAAFTAAG